MAREAADFDIPSFMTSSEYNRQRQERLRQIEEEERRLQQEAEKRRRYKLQRQAEIKRMRKIQRMKARVVKIVICGIVVTVMGTMIVNSLANKNEEPLPTKDPYEVSIVADDKGMSQDDMYTIPATVPVIEEEKVDIVSIDLSYEARKASINTNGMFKVGSEVNEYFFLVLNNNSNAYDLFLKYGEMYGVDPYILMAKAFQESSFNHNACLPGGKNYNGYGVGIMQHESPDGREIVAHNYITGQDDVMYLTMDNAINLEKNIQMGAMHFQKCLEDNNGNLLLALQSYNYGQGMVNSILRKYAEEKGLTVDAVKSSYTDTEWLSLVTDAHNNAWKYIRGWEGYYGDNHYIKHVLRYFIGSDTYYYYNGEKIIFDLNTFETIVVDENVRVIS